MGRFLKVVVSFIFLLVFIINCYSQKALQEVSVDLGSGSFFGDVGIPFDVPFIISAPVQANLREITVRYKIEDDDWKKWMRFPSPTKGKWSNAVFWKFTDEPAKDAKYHLTVGPLHPNIRYDFVFTALKTPSLGDTKVQALKLALFETLSKGLADVSDLDSDDLDMINDELNKKMLAAVYPATVILNPDRTGFALNIMDDQLGPVTNKILDLNDLIFNLQDEIIYANRLFDLASSSEMQNLQIVLGGIISKTIALHANSNAIWIGPIAPTIQALKDLKFMTLAGWLADPASQWAGIMDGSLKITQDGIVPADGPDPASFQILIAFFDAIAKGKIVDNSSTDPFAGRVQAGAEFEQSLTDVITAHEGLKRIPAIKAEVLKNFPDVIADKLLSQSYIVTGMSISDVVSEKSPYIGLDFGVAFMPNYSQLFAYQGVNFYFVPVNKDAPLGRMKGFWNNLSKRLSVHAGITQSLVSAENKNYQNLFKDVGSLLIGAGLRLSRILRVNYGAILFYEKSPNPLIDKKDFKAMYAISLTIDINIAKALEGVGKKLGFK